MKENEECCGGCCWFCYEQTDGWGQCIVQDMCDSMHCSDMCTTDKYISRDERDHHLDILKQADEWYKQKEGCVIPPAKDFTEAIEFAYKFIEVFGKL